MKRYQYVYGGIAFIIISVLLYLIFHYYAKQDLYVNYLSATVILASIVKIYVVRDSVNVSKQLEQKQDQILQLENEIKSKEQEIENILLKEHIINNKVSS